MDPATVSVVIPAHNEERTLPRVLEALAAQDRDGLDVEVLVVDDASTDGTAALVDAFARDHPWVRVLRNDPNLGLSRSLNRGIEAARGDVVVTLHADIAPRRPDWLRRLAEPFDDASVGAVGSTVHAHVEGMSLVDKVFLEARPRPMLGNKADAYRRAALVQLGGFDTSFRVAGEDADLVSRLVKQGYRLVFPPGADVDHLHGSHQVGLAKHLSKEIQYAEVQPRLWRRHRYMSAGLQGATLVLLALNLAGLLVEGARDAASATLWAANALLLVLPLLIVSRDRRGRVLPFPVAYLALGVGAAMLLGRDPVAHPATVLLLGILATHAVWDAARAVAKAVRLRDARVLVAGAPLFALQDIWRGWGVLKGLPGFLRP